MHPALITVLITEHERELVRRTRDAWQQPATRPVRPASRRPRRAHRLTTALARGLAFFS
jgi:hypothetical protein